MLRSNGYGSTHDPYAKISHGGLRRVSQQLSVILESKSLIPGPGYILEVSSPGMDRALNKPADFERFQGRLARSRPASHGRGEVFRRAAGGIWGREKSAWS